MFVLNTLRVTEFVTSSVAVSEVVTWVKSMYVIKLWLRQEKKRTCRNQRHI